MDNSGITNENMPTNNPQAGMNVAPDGATAVPAPAPTVVPAEAAAPAEAAEVAQESVPAAQEAAPTEAQSKEDAPAEAQPEKASVDESSVMTAGEYKLPDRVDAPDGKDYLIACGVCAGAGAILFLVLAAIILAIMRGIMCSGAQGGCTSFSGAAVVVAILLIIATGVAGGVLGGLLYWKKLHKVPMGATPTEKPPIWIHVAGAAASCLLNFCLMPIIMLLTQ